MTEKIIIPAPEDLKVQLLESEVDELLDRDLQGRIENAWQAEQKKRATPLFNGKILSFIGLHEKTLIGKFVDYKQVIASKYDEELKSRLRCIPVSVSGLTLAGQHMLVGKRSPDVTSYPGYYEFAPSGGIDDHAYVEGEIDFRGQVVRELEEETALDPSCVEQVKPIALIQDLKTHLIDICLLIRVDPRSTEMTRRTDEYRQIFWLDRTGCLAFLEANQRRFVSESAKAFHYWDESVGGQWS